MSWLFSQALVEEYSEASCSDGEPCAELSVMPTPHGFWRNDKMMEFSRLSQFGLTLTRLTADRGEALLMSFLAGFRVRISVRPVRARELKGRDLGFGVRCSGSFARFDLDSCSWKTPQFLLLGDWESYLETWPKSGTMRSGMCWLRPTWEPTMAESVSGSLLLIGGVRSLWPTPCAMEPAKDLANYQKTLGLTREARGGGKGPNLATAVKMFPTPTVLGNHNRKGLSAKSGNGLATAVNLSLSGNYPTPTRSMMISADMEQARYSGSSAERPSYAAAKEIFRTPVASDGDRGGVVTERMSGSSLRQEIGGSLNPPWVEWLMGWPLGWTGLKPLEMDRYRSWLRLHSGF